jgi:hypothetical protein
MVAHYYVVARVGVVGLFARTMIVPGGINEHAEKVMILVVTF